MSKTSQEAPTQKCSTASGNGQEQGRVPRQGDCQDNTTAGSKVCAMGENYLDKVSKHDGKMHEAVAKQAANEAAKMSNRKQD